MSSFFFYYTVISLFDCVICSAFMGCVVQFVIKDVKYTVPFEICNNVKNPYGENKREKL